MRHSAAHRKYFGLLPSSTSTAVGGPLKRAVDVFFATLALIMLAPILVLTAVLIRLVLGKPIIVIERSVGLGGKVFGRLRFRAERDSVTSDNPCTEAITTSLRASGTENLPQLYNVVRCDMSLVGPEVVGAQQALLYGVEGPELLRARPGLVSVRRHARHILKPDTGKIGLERIYIMRWSLWLDVRIAFGALARSHVTDADRPTK